jgi:pimeloyl-ACP methyl ester carboxylesterase
MPRLLGWLLGTTAAAGAGLALFSLFTARRVEAAVPAQGRFLEVGGQHIHYTDTGSGPAIVLLHGLGGQVRNFPREVIGPLSHDFRVVAIDRPGSGHSRRPLGAPAHISGQVRTIDTIIRHLQLDRPLVVGHSLGGAMALALALDHTDVVGGLALVAPLTQPQEQVPTPFRALVVRSRWLRLLAAWTVAVPGAMARGAAALQEVFGPDPIPLDYGTEGGGLLSLRPSSFYAASSDLVAINDELPGYAARYNTLTVPVGILFGTADRILDPAVHGRITAATIPGTELDLVDGGGHMTPITAPERTVAFIRRMAAKLPRTQKMLA